MGRGHMACEVLGRVVKSGSIAVTVRKFHAILLKMSWYRKADSIHQSAGVTIDVSRDQRSKEL